MKNIKSILLGLSLTASFAFAGCGSDVVKEFESIADKVCACKDSACATKEMEAIGKLKEPSSEPSESDMKKITEASAKMAKCAAELQIKEATK